MDSMLFLKGFFKDVPKLKPVVPRIHASINSIEELEIHVIEKSCVLSQIDLADGMQTLAEVAARVE